MAEAATTLKWGVERRLEFIEFRLFWEGSINRAGLVEAFGVSVPQASKDLTFYQERAPGNMEYDTRAKRYVAAEKFMLRFLDPDPYVYLAQLRSVAEGAVPSHDSWIAALPSADVDQLRDRPRELIVSIGADGRYVINKTELQNRSVDGIASAMLGAAPAGSDSVVIISADANAPHQSVVSAMEAARRAGLSQITFATQSSAAAGQ